MNKTEEIIKVAIEGGYIKNYGNGKQPISWYIYIEKGILGWKYHSQNPYQHKSIYQVFCDPLFWQAIGKAKGWEITKVILKLKEMKITAVRKEDYIRKKQRVSYNKKTPNKWKQIALKFHRINLTQSFDDAINYLYELIK